MKLTNYIESKNDAARLTAEHNAKVVELMNELQEYTTPYAAMKQRLEQLLYNYCEEAHIGWWLDHFKVDEYGDIVLTIENGLNLRTETLHVEPDENIEEVIFRQLQKVRSEKQDSERAEYERLKKKFENNS